MNSRVWKREVTELAARYGCTVDSTNNQHLKIMHPEGWFVFCSLTPSDGRALRYVESDLRRKAAGVWR